MAFSNWEEKVISNDKGKRLVHYYLKDGLGKKVLAVVGKEESLRHMSYVMTNQFSMMMMVSSPSLAFDFGSGRLRWKSRRDLIDWLDSIVSGWYQMYEAMMHTEPIQHVLICHNIVQLFCSGKAHYNGNIFRITG